jgi:5-formyltetrahydrofolate cyclo-ligase
VNKSQIRNKIIKIRKKKFNKDLKIDLGKFISFLKINEINPKSIGGYYPSNYEIDDLDILNLLKKKKFQSLLANYKKK